MQKWADDAVFYHIYPLGFCGAPMENGEEEEQASRILKVIDWIPHLKEIGITAVYFGPLFESVSHGYDTIDYYKIDRRLGGNQDFKEVCRKLHEAGIKVVVDGVFNHVGRAFKPFLDVKQNREGSAYKDWFVNVNFGGNSPYNDGFYYEGWEGHYELVKLNLWHPDVKGYLFGAVEKWIREFDIDGIRLDVAYCLDEGFLRELRSFTDRIGGEVGKDIWLMGEMIHGDYGRLLKPEMLHSTTDYECYKGIYSSHNDKNYFEINHSMNRLFARGGLYQGAHLYNFVDNHDVNRIASTLRERRCIYNVYTLLFMMPGIPSIYYGSEWQIEGRKENGSDAGLRPCIELEQVQGKDEGLVGYIAKLAAIKKSYPILSEGLYEQIIVKNEQLIFARVADQKRIYIALNLADHEEHMSFKIQPNEGMLVNLLDQSHVPHMENGECHITLKPFSSQILIDEHDVVEIHDNVETAGKVEEQQKQQKEEASQTGECQQIETKAEDNVKDKEVDITKVDYASWKRREVYEFFSSMSDPFFSVTFKVDVTTLYEYVKKRKLSFYYGLVYLCTEAINEVEGFMYVPKGEEIFKLSHRKPSFTDLRRGEEQFYIVTMPLEEGIDAFCEAAKRKSEMQEGFIDMAGQSDDLIYISCLPWLEMTAFTNERDFNKDDAVPRVTWGKYVEENGRKILHLSLELNHRLVDGYHVGKFSEILEQKINELEEK